MPDNPYAPPEAPAPEEKEVLQSVRGLPYGALLLSFGAYCLAMEGWVSAYAVKDMISFDSMPPLPILCFLIGSGALMAGVGRHVYLPWLGKHAFWLAAAVFAIGIAAADGSSAFGGAARLLFGLGLAIGLFGGWVVHRACTIIMAHYAREESAGAPEP